MTDVTLTIDKIKTYADLAEFVGDAVLCNSIAEVHDLELENGSYEDEDGGYCEVFQYYIISDWAAGFLMDYTDEIVYYCYDLDIYVWGITHFGTVWDYVPFSFPNDEEEEDDDEE